MVPRVEGIRGFSGSAPCPRCGEPLPEGRPGASSRLYRVDPKGQVEICSECGMDEVLRDFRGLPPVTIEGWPIDPAERFTS